MLAAYCLQREHLSSIGLAFAAKCEPRDLLHYGSSAVFDLIEKLKPRIGDGHKPSAI